MQDLSVVVRKHIVPSRPPPVVRERAAEVK